MKASIGQDACVLINRLPRPDAAGRRCVRALGVMALGATLASCQAHTVAHSPVVNAPGRPVATIDPSSAGPVTGLGLEGQDIVAMSDQMMRDILNDPRLANAQRPPRVIVDSEYFLNESSQRINKNIITDRLRVGLNRASAGRMVFVGRHYADMVERERDLKRQGRTDVGTIGMTRAQFGGDYRLGGRFASLDSADRRSGTVQRFMQVVFEMVDLESGAIVWTGEYTLARAGQDDVVYR